jgi:hypothetical protein
MTMNIIFVVLEAYHEVAIMISIYKVANKIALKIS